LAVAASAADIVDTAVSAGNFTTRVTALKAAGLVETLKGAGPFRVFAPTDEAFAKLPAGTVGGLLKDPAKLKDILLYHVVSGQEMAASVVKAKRPRWTPENRPYVDTSKPANEVAEVRTRSVIPREV
jgi:uncharacterized surface protein with fasciclin (FAS1) repeats